MAESITFKIVDGTYPPDEEFIELYNEGYRKKEIMEKINITERQYISLRRRLGKGDKLQQRSKNYHMKEPYYTPRGNIHINRVGSHTYFKVWKKGEYYCNCASHREAELIVERLKQCNWDKSKIRQIRAEVWEVMNNDR